MITEAPNFCPSCVSVECLETWSMHAHKAKFPANLWNTLAEFPASTTLDSFLMVTEPWNRPLSWCSHLEFLPLISMLPNRGWKNKIVWFLFAKWLLAFIIVIRYEEHDQDGGSMIKVYWAQFDPFFWLDVLVDTRSYILLKEEVQHAKDRIVTTVRQAANNCRRDTLWDQLRQGELLEEGGASSISLPVKGPEEKKGMNLKT